MRNKFISLTVASLIISNNMYHIQPVYAIEEKKTNQTIEVKNENEQDVVYLSKGQGSEEKGDGSQQNPYENINTALDKVKDGGTIKILGTVYYTRYKVHTDGSALPLFINKNITIEGGSKDSSLSSDSFILRAPIQLGANVTFKNMSLQMTPQVILGRESLSQSSKAILGEEVKRGATIYAAGNKLTIDNVNTKVGTSASQDDARPYISGGSYKNQGKIGPKAIINIINPNSQTKISAIYAGDYWEERDLDVEININGSVVERKIYTGGIEKSLNGNVNISLGDKSDISSIDRTNHKGNVNLKLEKDTINHDLDINDINNLYLEENSKLILKNESKFNANNVMVGRKSLIDFRKMSTSPIINGNFQGENLDNIMEMGTILLSDKQTLDVKGEVIGTTRLNYRDTIYSQILTDNHKYIKAKANSSGEFIIESDINENFRLEKNLNDNNRTTWTARRNIEKFKDFKWDDEPNKIINPSPNEEYEFPIKFINEDGKQYIPYGDDWYDFEFTVKKVDGTILDEDSALEDSQLFFTINYFTSDLIVNIFDEDYCGEITLTVRHKPSNKTVSKKVLILKEKKELKGKVNIKGDLVEGKTISADTSNLPSDIKGLKFKWYVNNVEVAESNNKNFTLTKNHIGKKVKVKVTAENYVGSIFSEEFLVKTLRKPIINGAKNITLKVGDSFSQLKGISATDALNKDITSKIRVSGKVDTSKPGVYKLTYKVIDSYGNTTIVTRNITVKPKNVVGVKATSNGYNSIKVTWNKSYNIKGYEVYRATSKTGKYTLKKTVTSGNTLSYTNTGITTGKTYYYKVRSYAIVNDKKLYSDYSSIVYTKSKLSKPSVTLSAGSEKVYVKWKKVSGASGYEVYRATSKTGKYTLKKTVTSGNTLSYTNTGLTIGKTYYYKVRSYVVVNDKKLYSDYSSIVYTKPKLSTPSVTLSAGSKKAYVKWKKVSGASGYEVYRSTSKTGKYIKVKTLTSGNTTSYTNTKLTSKKGYYYKLRAYRTVNGNKVYSSYSSIKYIKIK